MITKDKKKEILEKLDKVFKTSKNVTFVNFHGLSVKNAMEIRRKMRAEGVGYFVAKKTLLKKALEKRKMEGTLPSLEGETGIAYGEDLVAPSREAFGFQKKFEGVFKLLGGIFDGKFMGKDEITAVASIPPLKTLRAQFVNVINSPIQGLVVALNKIAEKKGV